MCCFVKTGRIKLTVGTEQFVLGEEEGFSLDLAVEHDFANAHDDITEILWSVLTHLDF